MDFIDYYQLLNIEPNADTGTVEAACQQRQAEAESQDWPAPLAEVQQVLTHPERRARYDRLRAAWLAHQQNSPDLSFDWSSWMRAVSPAEADEAGIPAEFSDFYRAIFIDIDRAEAEPQPGDDIHRELEISLEEAFNGGTRILQIGKRRIQVKLPRGIDTGAQLRVRGEGGKGRGGAPNGDLYLEVKIAPHPLFERKGDDLHLDLPVDLYTAVLGGEAIVPMLKGKLKLKIPPETQSGKVFRLKGLGMPKLKQPDERGDLYAKVIVQIPQNLTEEEIALFEELADLRGL